MRCATFSQGYLNRQIIILLHSLGVPIEFFIHKQQVEKQYISLESIKTRLEEKADKIHSKFGSLLSNTTIDMNINYTHQKNKML